jgi:arylsulfatase
MPKDILVLMTDQHRADWIGAFGSPWVRTPNLDKLASEGVRFTNCSTTCPVCMPARASFLTGQYPHNFAMWSNAGRVQDVSETYLHPLRGAGYRTCHIGKSHLHSHGGGRHLNNAIPYMNALGWDDVLECTGPLSTVCTKSILTDWMQEQGIYQTFLDDYKKRAQHKDGLALWPTPLPEGKHMDDFVANTAVDYIMQTDTSQPAYVFVGLGGPHNPFDAPVSFDHYAPEDMPAPLPPDPAPEWLAGPALTHHHAVMGHNPNITAEQWARNSTLYSAKVEHMDSLIGKVLEAWYERRGRDTWVMFWSDHGEMLGDKARTCKAVFYRSSLRVPVILRPPMGLESGVASDGLCSTVDLTATLLDIGETGDKSRNVFGDSLRPALEDPSSVGADYVVSEIDGRTMIYDGRWKMVVNRKNDLLKLFDTQQDPDETLNLAGKKGTETEVERLRGLLLGFLLRTADNQFRDVNS